ncbi:MAG: hypothetical protein KDC60_07260, partial [Bacteroidetes bacterium]|nr:hypothetical protein [Bacteroidota bacterium]
VDNTVEVNEAIFETSNDLSSNEQTLDKNSLVFLKDNALDYSISNIANSIKGPHFTDIDNKWKDTYTFTLYNQSTEDINIISKSNYIEDPDTLRDDIFVAIHRWEDNDNDGKFDDSELGVQLDYNSILRWRNDTFNLGKISSNSMKKFVLVFDGSGISSANLGKKAIYSFKFYPELN